MYSVAERDKQNSKFNSTISFFIGLSYPLKLYRIRITTKTCIRQRINILHLLMGQFEVKDIVVLTNP